MPTLLIDGWWLTCSGVGLATYAARVTALLTAPGMADLNARVVWPAHAVPAGTPPNAVTLASPRVGHPLLDAALWQLRISLYARRAAPGTALFSPGPFWSPWAPPHLFVAYHDCIYRHFPRYLGRRAIRRWLAFRAERFLGRCDSVVTESRFSRTEISRFIGIPEERIAVIAAWLPDGFGASADAASLDAVRARYGLPGRYWLYVGGYDYRKNVGFLLDAYARAARQTPCPPLVLAGRIPAQPGAAHGDIHGALRAGGLTGTQVVRPGYIDAADLATLYAGAELTVYPSLYEGYGLPPLEAMGCGCPALVADNSSLPEVVTDPDYRFPTQTPDVLAAKLADAALRRLPLNPGFRRDAFTEQVAREAYRAWLIPKLQRIAEATRAHRH